MNKKFVFLPIITIIIIVILVGVSASSIFIYKKYFETNGQRDSDAVAVLDDALDKEIEVLDKEIKNSINKTKDAQIKAYLSNAMISAAVIYNKDKSYKNITCANQSIQNICDSIKKVSGVDPVIHSSSSNFCMYSKLLEPQGSQESYFCIEGSGVRSTTTINPTGTGYCDGKTFHCPANN